MGWCLLGLLQAADAKGQSADRPKAVQEFDGRWWAGVSAEERVGFLYALDDCLTYDVKPAVWFDGTWAEYQRKITAFYSAAPGHRTTPVETVFTGLGKIPAKGKTSPAEERYGDEFWRAHPAPARRGFLEGYLSCRARAKSSVHWSKPLAYYLDKLDDVYNADDRHGEDVKEYPGSVASALMKLRDVPGR